MLRPLGPVYGAVVAARQRAAGGGRLRAKSLAGVVLSVGSLSAGGAGKTPFVLALVAALERREYAVRILSRGYGRRSREVAVVDPAGDADRFGDEPLLLARRSGVPVVVGAKRYAAGRVAESLEAAERTGPPQTVVHVLDDGFQHRALARDLDIVLLTAKEAADELLPAGDLREPLGEGIRRADVIVLRENEAPPLVVLIDAICGDGPSPGNERSPLVVWIRRELVLPERRPARPMLFCGIARPAELRAMLAEAGVAVVGEMVFRDHHRYRERDAARLVKTARACGADGFVTTEKDAVKLNSAMRAMLAQVGEVMVPELRVSFLEEHAAMERMIALVPRMNRRRVR